MLAVIDQGGYGAQAAAPLVRNIFNYIVANPGMNGAVKTPTPASPASQTAPATNPPLGTPTTTTTTTDAGHDGRAEHHDLDHDGRWLSVP